MKHNIYKKYFKKLLILLGFIATKTYSQTADSVYSASQNNAKNVYLKFISENSNIYNGRNELDLEVRTRGHSYFENQSWQNGAVLYDNVIYENVPLKLNLITQQLIVNHPNGYMRIQLIKEKISAFTIAGHRFINMSLDSNNTYGFKTSFLEILTDKKTLLLGDYSKAVVENLADGVYFNEINTSKNFYIRKSNNIIQIRNEKLFDDWYKEKNVSQFVRQQSLDFKKNPENAFTKLVEYCDFEN